MNEELDPMSIINEVIGPDEEEQEAAYQLNRKKQQQFRNLNPNRFQEQIDNLPEITMQDVSELAIDAKMAMEAAKKVPGGPVIKAGAALGSVAMRRLGGKYIDDILDKALNSSFFKDK